MMSSAGSASSRDMSQVKVAYLIRSFPRLSQTFILTEILTLEAQGAEIRILALVNPDEPLVQPGLQELRAPVTYLESALPSSTWRRALVHLRLLVQRPARYLRALGCVLREGREHESGYSNYSAFRCLSLAVTAAALLRAPGDSGTRIDHLHAHFAHDPTFIASLVHLLTGISYSFTAHARDLYQIGHGPLVRRSTGATHVITCCRANRDFLVSALPESLNPRVRLIYHGVDSQFFRPRDSRTVNGATPTVVTVGRLVAKKGLADLVRACGIVGRALDFKCLIFGDGPQRAELLSLIEAEGLGGRVQLMGSLTQRELIAAYQRADVFALTPFVTKDGDRDGIPNVLMEAMACGLPVLTTDAGGIAELVTHLSNGFLLPPRDVDALATGLRTLLEDPELRARLGGEARKTVTRRFDSKVCISELGSIFRAIGGTACPQPS
jgi:glycosyltransferase involved in cell wall biosynthesis